MPSKKRQTGLRLNDSMYEKIKYLSENDGRSINNYVESVLRHYLDTYEREHGPIKILVDTHKD